MAKVIKSAVIAAAAVFVTIAVVASGGTLAPLFTSGALAFGGSTAAFAIAAQYAIVTFVGAVVAGGIGMLTSRGVSASRQNFGTKIAGRGAQVPRSIVYGQCRVGGTIVKMHTSGTKNNKLHLAIVLAGHEIESLDGVYLNDNLLTTTTTTVGGETVYRVTNSKYKNTDNEHKIDSNGTLIQYTFHDGSQTTVDGLASTNASSRYPSTAKFQGMAYVYMEIIYDPEKMPGLPPVSFRVKGKKVYDPRTSTTAYSNNPALVIRDYLTDTTYGLRALSSEINDTTAGGGFAAAANACEADVTLADNVSTEDRFTLNGFVNASSAGDAILEGFLSSCAGKLTHTNGKFNIFVGTAQTPTLTINDDDVLDTQQLTTKSGNGDLFNGIKALYVDKEQDYQGAETPILVDSTYLAEDTPSGEQSANYKKILETQLPFTTTHTMAQRLQKIQLKRHRESATLSLLTTLEFMKLQPGDWVNVNNDRLSYSAKTFEVLSTQMEFAENEGVVFAATRLVLQEVSAGIYNYAYSEYSDPQAAGSTPPGGDLSVGTPTAGSLAQRTRPEGPTAKIDIIVSWTNAAETGVQGTEIQYKESGESSYDVATIAGRGATSAVIQNVQVGKTYDVRIRHFSWDNVYGSFVSFDQLTIAEPDTLSAPGNPSATTDKPFFIELTWTNPTNDNFRAVEVHYSTSSGFTPDSNTLLNTYYGEPAKQKKVILGVSAGLAYDTNYYFKLRSVNVYGTTSGYTNQAQGVFKKAQNADVENLNASAITAGTIDASTITVENIDAGNISTGTLDSSRVNAGEIVVGGLESGVTIDAGSLTMSAGGHIKGGQAEYNDADASGFFLGYDTDAYKFSIGNSDNSQRLTFDGSNLSVKGTLTVGSTDLTEANTLNSNTNATDVAGLPQATFTSIGASSYSPAVNGSRVTWTENGTAEDWDTKLVSDQSFSGGAFVTFVVNTDNATNARYMVGLANVATGDSYNVIDYAIYVRGSASDMLAFESGSNEGEIKGSISAGDVCTVLYDGNKVQYIINGSVAREVNLTSPLTGQIYAHIAIDDGATHDVEHRIDGLQFGPVTSVVENLVDGVQITGGGITMSSGGAIKGGQTAFATGDGYFLGYDTDDYKFSVGDSSNYIQWNGSALSVKGTITVGSTNLTEANTLNSNTSASDVGLGNVDNLDAQGQAQSGLITGTTITGGGIIFNQGGALNTTGKTSESDTTNGFFLGYNGTNYTFGVGDATHSMIWDGTDLTVTGDIVSDNVTLSSGGTLTDPDGIAANVAINLAFPVDGLTYYWPCNSIADTDGDGNEELQEMVSGKTGIHSGSAPTLSTDSPSGNSVVNASGSGWTLLNDTDADALEGSNGFAWAIWFKSETTAGDSQARIIGRDASDGWALIIDQDGTSQGLVLYGEPGTESMGTVASDEWHHFCLSEDGNGTISGYLDGELVSTEAYTPVVSSRPVVMGCNTESSINTAASVFIGKLTEVRAYNRALTAIEVRALYKVPAGGIPQKIDGDLIVDGTITTAQLAADSVTATEINVSNLAAISADLGSVTAGSIDIGGGDFTVSSAGVMTATGATVSGAITATSLSLVGTSIAGSQLDQSTQDSLGLADSAVQDTDTGLNLGLTNGTVGGINIDANSINSGSHTSFGSTANGFYIGSNGQISIGDGSATVLSFDSQSSEPTLDITGLITATRVTVGSGATTAAMSAEGPVRFWAGSENPSSTTPFVVESDGEVFARNLVLTDADGNEYFNAQDGFTALALTTIAGSSSGVKVTTYSEAFSSGTGADQGDNGEIEVAFEQTSNVTFSAKISGGFRAYETDSNETAAQSGAIDRVPDNVTVMLRRHTSSGFTSSQGTLIGTTTFTKTTNASPTSTQYQVVAVTDFFEPELEEYFAAASVTRGAGAVGTTGQLTASFTVSSLASGTYFIKAFVSTTDTNYDSFFNKVTSSTARTIEILDNTTDGGFTVDGGANQSVGAADITGVIAGTNLTGGGLTGSVTLGLASTIAGDHTFSNNVTVSGNLTVNGTTTTLNTATLDVEDKNITLNYGSGDTSGSADGAGITIQDAVNSSTNATMLWDATNDKFDFSHPLQIQKSTIGGELLHLRNSYDGGYRDDLIIENTNDRDAGITIKTAGGQYEMWLDSNGDDSLIFSPGDNTSDIALELYQNKDADFGGSLDVAGGITYTANGYDINTDTDGNRTLFTFTRNGSASWQIWHNDNQHINFIPNSTSYKLQWNGNDLWSADDFTSSDISNWDEAYGWGDHASAGYLTSSSLTFDGLSGKTSGTGDYSTTGDIVAGRGSGSIALTINDSKGNSNVTFNHQNGVPDQNGNAARIEVNTDSSTGATMYFEVKSGVTGGTSVDLTGIFRANETGLYMEGGKKIYADSELTLQANDTDFVVQDTTDSITNFIWRDYSASKLYLGASGSADVEIRSDLLLDAGKSMSWEGASGTFALNVYHATTNVVARFESGDSEVWIDLHDSASGTYGALLGHTSTELFKVADQGVNVRMSLNNNGLLDTDAGYSVAGTTRIDSGGAGLFNTMQVTSSETANTSSGVNFLITDSVSNQSFTGVRIDHNASGSQAHTADNAHTALLIDMDTSQTGGDLSNENRAYGIQVDVRGTGDTDARYGVYSYTETQHSAGSVTNNIAVYGFAVADDTGTGRTTNNIGGQFLAYEYGTGTGGSNNHYGIFSKALLTSAADKNTSSATGVYGEVEVDTSGTTTTLSNAYVFYAQFDNDASDTTISNSYLFYGNYSGTLPSTAWGIYIPDTVANYFGGYVRSATGFQINSSTVIDDQRNLDNIANATITGKIVLGSSADSDYLTGTSRMSVDGYIMTKGIVNEDETGTGPAAIVFGNGATYGTDQISLVTGGLRRLYIDASGNLDFGNGNVGSVGTISSGAITSTGSSLINTLQVGTNTQQNSYGRLQVNQSTNNDEAGIGILSQSAGRSMRLWVDETNSYINSGNAGSGFLYLNEDVRVTSGGNFERTGSHISGCQIGGYDSIANSREKSNPIHVIGSNYLPTETSVTNMWGIGFTRGSGYHADLSWTNGDGWGLYAAAGAARIFLDAENGVLEGTGGVAINGTTVINSSRNLTNIGTISSGAITASSDINLTAGTLKLRSDVALDHDGSSLYIKAPSAIYFYPGNSNQGNINTNGTLNLKAYQVNGTTVIDSSRNLTNIANLGGGNGNFARLGRTYNTATYFEVGYGSGAVGLTINDGGGNAQLTFNHTDETADANGSSARIRCDVDSSGADILFLLDDSVTAGFVETNNMVQAFTVTTSGVSSSGNVTAYSSDRRLKENFKHIDDPLGKIAKLNGMTFDWKDIIDDLKFKPKHRKDDVGLIAQEVEEVVPQAVAPAPFDWVTTPDGTGYYSKSGQNYMTVQYEKLIPLLVEGIKDQQKQIEDQQEQINELKALIKEKDNGDN